MAMFNLVFIQLCSALLVRSLASQSTIRRLLNVVNDTETSYDECMIQTKESDIYEKITTTPFDSMVSKYDYLIQNMEIEPLEVYPYQYWQNVELPAHCECISDIYNISSNINNFDIIYNIFSQQIDEINSRTPINPSTLHHIRLKYLCILLSSTNPEITSNIDKYINNFFNKLYKHKIFQIGPNKAGTSTLSVFLAKNGISSMHHEADLTKIINQYDGTVVKHLQQQIDDSNVSNSNKPYNLLLHNYMSNTFEQEYLLPHQNDGINTESNILDDLEHQSNGKLINPWYLDTFGFYADYGYAPYGNFRMTPFHIQYYLQTNGYDIDTANELGRFIMGADEDNGNYFEVSTIYYHEIFNTIYQDDSYFILNIRNIYKWLLSKIKHGDGRLVFYELESFNQQRDYINQWLEEHSKPIIPEITVDDVLKRWYITVYMNACDSIKYFVNNGHEDKLLIFDIENDSVNDIVEFFKDVYQLDGDVYKRQNTNFDFETEEKIAQAKYSDTIKHLIDIIKKQEEIEPEYSEKEFLMNIMCPQYFWKDDSVMDTFKRFELMSLDEWNEFWRLIA